MSNHLVALFTSKTQENFLLTRQIAEGSHANTVWFSLYTVGDRPQGVAGDCNSLAETHAWFDSRVAHHSILNKLQKRARIR